MMDRSAADFRSLTAAIEHIKYTAVVKDTSTESGEIYVRKDAKMRIDFQSPDPRTILRNGDNLYIYTPKINRVEEYNIGKNRAMADQYLALGLPSPWMEGDGPNVFTPENCLPRNSARSSSSQPSGTVRSCPR